MKVNNYVVKCVKCGKKQIVSLSQFGINHVFNISIMCNDCVKKYGLGKEWTKEHKEEAEQLMEEFNRDD